MFVCVWNENGVGISAWNEMSMWLPYYSKVWGSFLKSVFQGKLPYKRKYWRGLNLAIWLQTRRLKILVELEFLLGPAWPAGQDRQMLILLTEF